MFEEQSKVSIQNDVCQVTGFESVCEISSYLILMKEETKIIKMTHGAGVLAGLM